MLKIEFFDDGRVKSLKGSAKIRDIKRFGLIQASIEDYNKEV